MNISKSSAECIRVLLGGEPNPLPPSKKHTVDAEALKTIHDVVRVQSQYWKCFSIEVDELSEKLKDVHIDNGNKEK